MRYPMFRSLARTGSLESGQNIVQSLFNLLCDVQFPKRHKNVCVLAMVNCPSLHSKKARILGFFKS